MPVPTTYPWPVPHILRNLRRDLREDNERQATQSASRAAVDTALGRPCPRHDAPPGRPCWDLPQGLCGTRVRP